MFRSIITLWAFVLILLTPALAATVTANFTSSSSIPVIAASYTATGNYVAISLDFTPPTGTNLTIVKNTGLAFISGKFSNLANGQGVNLSYNGITYKFVANYYGGSGNDLVLHWAYQDLAAWGGNNYGQLGNGDNIGSSIPLDVIRSGGISGKTVVAVSAAHSNSGWGDTSYSLALCSDGTLAAWGENLRGQLGNGTMTDSSVPVIVTQNGVLAHKTVVAIAAGAAHSLVLCSDGTLATWGRNDSGQLGDGTTTSSRVPVIVTQSGVLAGKTVAAISAGAAHSLVLCSDGNLATWGDNGSGRLGNGTTTSSSVAVLVTQNGVLAGKTVKAISAGATHNLALCSDGTLVAWGYNFFRQLGNGTTTSSSVPLLVTQNGVLSGKTVVAISAGAAHSLALNSDGTLAAWGDNGSGRLGDGTTTNSSVPILVTPSSMVAGKTMVGVSASYEHNLALCSDGSLVSWGKNSNGQLGDGSSTTRTVPVLVTQSGLPYGKAMVAISARNYHSIALRADGRVAAWGGNSFGELTTDRTVPVLVLQNGVLAACRTYIPATE